MIEEASEDTRRRGPAFVVKLVIIVLACLVALAIAGDDELRASLLDWTKSPDRPWR